MSHQLDYQPRPDVTGEVRALRRANALIVLVAAGLYACAFGRSGGVEAVLFFSPFTMFPFAVNLVLSRRWRTSAGQETLMWTSLAYAGWFALWYMILSSNRDPQSPIGLLFIGVYATPVLALLWWLGFRFERREPAT